MLLRASKKTSLRSLVVRAGQLCGDLQQGAWNPKEWVPAMVGTGQELGCLPAKEEGVCLLPVDIAARSLLELIDLANGNSDVVHLMPPHPVQWNDIVGPIAGCINVPLVPFADWLALLEAKASTAVNVNAEQSNAVELFDFFKSSNFGVCIGADVPCSNSKALSASPTLASLQPLNEENAKLFARFWLDAGHIRL